MTWSAEVVDGPTAIIGISERDVRITSLSRRGTDPWMMTLAIPVARDDLLETLVDADKRIIRTAVLELSWDDVLWHRFRPTGAPYQSSDGFVSVPMKDRRYNLWRRIAGRFGATPSLNDPLPTDEGSLGAWTLSTTGSPTIDIAPQDPGDATVFGTAVRMSSDGVGPDFIAFTVDVPADSVASRVIVWAGYELLPLGGLWSPNAAGFMTEIVVTDVDLGEIVDSQGWDVDTHTPQQQFLLPHPVITIPPGQHASVEFRVYFQTGLILVEAFNGTIQEVMSWADAPAGQRIRDLINRANDNSWGHSDTFIVATTDSVPDGDVKATRVIYSKERQLVGDCINEVLTSAALWPWLEPQIDGTDLFHTSEGETVVATFADSTADYADGVLRAEVVSWEAQGDRQTDGLSVFAPTATEYTGDRLVVDFAEDAVVGPGDHDFGDELVEVGPPSGYDAKLAYQTVSELWKARQVSGTVTIKIVDLDDGVAAVTSGDLRVGNLIDGLVLGTGVRGVAGNYRIVAVNIDAASRLVKLDLNREADTGS